MMLQSALLHQPGFIRREHIAQMESLPRRFQPVVEKRWLEIYRKTEKVREANLFLLDVLEELGGNRTLLAANDEEICAYAKKKSDECFRAAGWWKEAAAALEAMRKIASDAGIQPPDDKKIKPQGQRSRLLCELWWRRQIRKTLARQVEAAAIKLGMVSKRAAIYASDETVTRRAGQKRRNKALLETIIAVNDEGDEYTLQELSNLSVSNPEIRRMELMMRIAGFDEVAQALDHAAEFWTITAPSKYHAVRSDGKPNPKYSNTTPREAQGHLCKGWAQSRAMLAKHGVKLYGFRVVEPHHDGTPHWHMCIFFDKQWPGETQRAAVPRVRAIMRRYALREDGREFGARRARFQAVAIDRSKGSAAGYLAKYISKNINGKGAEHEDDLEGGGNLADNAVRVDAWASCWGIRQFQQIGGAPVGVWRELRRLGEVAEGQQGVLDDLQAAADKKNWRRYIELMGGPTVARVDMPAKVRRVHFDVRSRYDGEGVLRVDGVESSFSAEYARTRWREWVLKRAHAPAWSSVNNCNGGIEENESSNTKNSGIMAWTGQIPGTLRRSEAGQHDAKASVSGNSP